jgi:hypothetical protein
MDAHVTPQEAVNRGLTLPSRCDVVVVLLWSRLGTPLPETCLKSNGERYWSGTEYEYLEAVGADQKPRVLLYRCLAPLEEAWRKSGVTETEAQREEQHARVERFFCSFKANDGSLTGSYQTYKTVAELAEIAKLQLREILQEKMLAHSRVDLGIARIFQTRTRAFLDEYLVSETGPVPFGGREVELERLDTWLRAPDTPPRMLVTAPAGRGKSALLVQWMRTLQNIGFFESEGWQLAFTPISVRIGTNRPEVFYEGLARRLAEITGEKLPTEAIHSANGFGYAIRDQLDRIAETGRKVVVVIDGLDEALHGSFDPAILPPVLPTNIRVLMSARWQLGDTDSRGWLERLGWDNSVRVETFELDRLDSAGIEDVLVKLGAPVDVLTREQAVVDRLTALTEGEPLLVRYYATDLWQRSSDGARITRDDLDTLRPGFGSYFRHWLERQEALWREENAGIDRYEVDRVLSVLAFALGPLEEADLLALVERIHGMGGLLAADRLLEPLRRFVFGDGKRDTGYVLSHPKIGEYLQRERFSARSGQLRSGFAAWGKAQVEALNSGEMNPKEASPYVLQFLPQHLDDAAAPPDDFMAMVEDGWRRAWEYLEGGQRGFASAVQTAWSSLRRAESVTKLGQQWRCTLVLSSIKSLGHNIPSELILAAAQRGVLTPRQAAHFVENKNFSRENTIYRENTLSLTERVKLLSEIAVVAGDSHALSAELASSALETASMARDEESRTRILCVFIESIFRAGQGLPEESRQRLRDPTLDTIRSIKEPSLRVTLLTTFAQCLSGHDSVLIAQEAWRIADASGLYQQRAWTLVRILPILDESAARGVKQQALRAAIAIAKDSDLAGAIAGLAPHLSPEQLGEALAAAAAVRDENHLSSALAALAPYLSPKQLGEALTAAKAICDEFHRSTALAALVPHLSPEQRHGALTAALTACKVIGYELHRSRALAALAPHLSPQQLGEALSVAMAIRDERHRTSVLAALAPDLSPEQLAGALAAATALRDENHLSSALAALAPHLLPEQLGEALAAATAVRDENHLSSALAALAPHLLPEQLGEALAAATAVRDENHLSSALAVLAPYLSPKRLGEALTAAKAIRDEFHRSTTLAALVPHLSPEQRHSALTAALTACKVIGYELHRSRALAALAPHLSPQQLGEALSVAMAIRDHSSALAGLIPHLSPGQRQDVLEEVLSAPTEIDREEAVYNGRRRDWRLSHLLTALAPYLSPKQLGEALTAAKAIRDEFHRSTTLAVLLPRLSPEQQFIEAFSANEATRDEFRRSATLSALVPRLSPEQLAEALAATRAIRDEFYRSMALGALARHLSPEHRHNVLGAALAAVRAIGAEDSRSLALADLASHLLPEQMGDALDVANAIRDEFHRINALAALAPHLWPGPREQMLDEALAAAKTVLGHEAFDYFGGRRSHSPRVLAVLAPHLSSKQLGEALAAAKAIHYEPARLSALAALTPYLSPKQRSEIANATEASYWYRDPLAVTALVPYLAPKRRRYWLGQALASAKTAGNEKYDASVLAALAPHLSREQLGDALATVTAIRDEDSRASALAGLAPYLAPAPLRDALACAQTIRSGFRRSRALTALARFLPTEQRRDVLHQAVSAANVVRDDFHRSSALAGLAPYLLPDQLDGALLAAKAIHDANCRSNALAALIVCLPHFSQKVDALSALIDSAKGASRDVVLSAAAATIEVLAELGGEAAVQEQRRAINDVCSWYP